jgi:hypothetical protein
LSAIPVKSGAIPEEFGAVSEKSGAVITGKDFSRRHLAARDFPYNYII